jgi:hypothetical protein
MDAKEEECLYWQKVGWNAHRLGLPFNTKDSKVLEHEQYLRAKAQNLSETSGWFEIFCAEFKAGLEPEIPDYCDQGDAEWHTHPSEVFPLAQKAAQLFKKK